MRTRLRPLCLLALTLVASHAAAQDSPKSVSIARGTSPADAAAFMTKAERELADLEVKADQAQWVADNFITDDTEALSAELTKNLNVAIQRLALDATSFDHTTLDPTLRRKFNLLKLSLTAPPPSDPNEAIELSKITASMAGTYGKGTYCRKAKSGGKQECLQINDLSRILAKSRDPAELLDAWRGWHTISRSMKPQYARFVELSNKGARELGFKDAGAMWRSNYDMTPDEFNAEVERLWTQVRPFYVSLHAYVRTKLNQKYGSALVPSNGLIPAHLLGDMWAEDWSNIFPLVAPATAVPSYDISQLLKAHNVDAVGMAHYAEKFFTSMGFAPLPPTFWERSLFVKPRDREVVCHPSAWDIDNQNDVRVKACLEQTGADFKTIHHEEGHDFYYLAYKAQPTLFQNGANDGFHEAIGDALALAITPEYLKTIGLLDKIPPASADTMVLLKQALEIVAFLPFGLLIDEWRWKVFSGEVKPANYNAAWWELRKKYQGISPPVARTEDDFDPGAKYHVPSNTPYARYFLADILEFQFYRAMCHEAGFTGPLYRCTFYGSKKAGDKLKAMLAAGQSKPWPETLYAMTGSRQMDPSAMLEYFAPLRSWLDAQNKGKPIGW
jgi:peptidyl-dipeptidase A